MEGLGPVAAAAAAFVGTHFLLSHPLRKPIVDTVGSAAFLGIYSAVAAVTLGWLALAYLAAPAGTLLWPVGDGLWAAATVVMLLAELRVTVTVYELGVTVARRFPRQSDNLVNCHWDLASSRRECHRA